MVSLPVGATDGGVNSRATPIEGAPKARTAASLARRQAVCLNKVSEWRSTPAITLVGTATGRTRWLRPFCRCALGRVTATPWLCGLRPTS